MKAREINSNFAEYYAKNALHEARHIRSAGSWLAEVLEDSNGLKGDQLPWEPTWDDVALDEGQLTIWGGWSGHGKSELLGQVILWQMDKGPCAIASLEMRPSETINRMIRQHHGAPTPSDEYKVGWLDWADERLYVYDAIERVRRESMLGFVMYCRNELKCKHIVIDSLTKCGIGKDDLQGQATFVDDLQNIAKATGAHVHLVTHLRKSGSAEKLPEPGKDDVRGAGEITDLADTVFMVYRNKFKDQLVADGQTHFTAKDGTAVIVDEMWDTKLKLVKNRHNGREMDYKLWRHPSGQYTHRRGRRMTHPSGPTIDTNTHKYLRRQH